MWETPSNITRRLLCCFFSRGLCFPKPRGGILCKTETEDPEIVRTYRLSRFWLGIWVNGICGPNQSFFFCHSVRLGVGPLFRRFSLFPLILGQIPYVRSDPWVAKTPPADSQGLQGIVTPPCSRLIRPRSVLWIASLPTNPTPLVPTTRPVPSAFA